MTGVTGYGSYVPLYRIERSTVAEQHGAYPHSGENAVPAHDEGVVSLAVNAAKNALDHAGVDGDALDAVYAATVSDPFDERGLAPHVVTALGAPGSVRVGDFEGSARAATTAVLAGRDAVEAGTAETVLVVAADVIAAAMGSSAEQTAGAGAGALVLGPDGRAATIAGASSETSGFVGRFAPSDGDVRDGDGRFNRANYLADVGAALARLDGPVAHAALPEHDGGWGKRALAATEVDARLASTFADVGYAGAASVLLDAAAAFETADPGEGVLLVGYGPGGCDALRLEAGDAPTPEMTTADYVASKEYVPYAVHRRYREAAGGGA